MNQQRRFFLILVALLVALPVGWVSEMHAQTTPPGVQGAAGQVEGKIKSVDPSGGMVTLEDGTQLTIPPSVKVQRAALKEGAIVKASFEERGGQKVVTSMEVRAK
jgi:Cu/Ag efflux protein CusF